MPDSSNLLIYKHEKWGSCIQWFLIFVALDSSCQWGSMVLQHRQQEMRIDLLTLKKGKKENVCSGKGENCFLSHYSKSQWFVGGWKRRESRSWLLCCGQVKLEFEELLKYFYSRNSFWVFHVMVILKYHPRLPCAQGKLSWSTLTGCLSLSSRSWIHWAEKSL